MLVGSAKMREGLGIGYGRARTLTSTTVAALMSMPVSIRTTVQNTPVGKCANSLTGKHAPHNGKDHCDRFTECLTCPTYVVVGSVKDLHRLFSFQLFLASEIEYMSAPELASWRDHKRELIGLIDRFTTARFARSVVEEAGVSSFSVQ